MSIITRSKARQIRSDHVYYQSLCSLIEQTFLCQKCSTLLTNPITLNCGHSICTSCVSNTETKLIKCPASDCSIETSIKDISLDVILSKLIDLFKQWKQEFTLHSQQMHLTNINELMLPELECQLCFNLLLNPTTSSCGHTLCKQCFVRSLDYNDSCPVCRKKLPSYTNLLNHSINHSIQTLTEKLYPEIVAQRKLSLKEELQNLVEETPLFICSLVFPKMPCYLHIFEPRYRLMIRRCMESSRQRFGIVLHVNRAVGFHEYGTMLEARNIEVLPDGRYLLDAVGSFRFRIIERGVRDGYNVGKIERIDDEDEIEDIEQQMESPDQCQSDISEEDPSKMSISELQQECTRFVEALKSGSAPWLFQRLNATVGPMPSDPSDFTFWIASIIPLDEQEKYEILPITSVKKRFIIVLKWIRRLSEQWWFDRMCTMMVDYKVFAIQEFPKIANDALKVYNIFNKLVLF
ncbi:hypothetical protein K502DRAFT_367341 [Neoconidiobolus thromboides FSU 785]|nr:hypothetical protein K502DRAFT_367341 [Neoconidiobolus thromboides FSU 785]